MRLECHLVCFVSSNVMHCWSFLSVFFAGISSLWCCGLLMTADKSQTDAGRCRSFRQSVFCCPACALLCPCVILLISLLSCRALLCPGVPFFLFVQPQGQVVLCSSKPFFCSAAQDFILFWFSVHNTTWLKLYFALFSAHCWAVLRHRPQDVRRLSMELLDYAAAEWQPFYWFIYLSILPL